MSAFETSPNFDQEPEGSVFGDLLDQMSYVMDDAFRESAFPGALNKPRKSISELVQIDTHSLEDQRLFSVLLTESGGKADHGVEMVRVFARFKFGFSSVSEAVRFIEENDDLPFKTSDFFVAHRDRSGEWRYSRVDESGIYPWLPRLKDLTKNDVNASLEGIDIIEAVRSETDPINQQEIYARQQALRSLDETYAKELIAKLDEWSIVPQN